MLWRNKRYRFGVVAQFSNVAAQVCAWTYLIVYVEQALGGSLEKGGAYLQASLLIFLASRFLMTWVIGYIRATKVLAVLAFLAVGLCLFAMASPNMAGVIAVVSLSFCLSLMFPTIYGVALKGLGPATKFGAAGLVMAIVGGAIMPLVQGKLVDATSAAISFIVPAGCFAVVGLYALYDLQVRAQRDRRRARPASPLRHVLRFLCRPRGRGVTGSAPRPRPRGRGRSRSPRAAATTPTSATTTTKQLEVVSWWTSGSESAALERPLCRVPMSRTRASTLVNGAVAGGAGSNAIVALAKRLQHDDPPDVWQTFAGKSVQGYASRGVGPQRRVGLRQRGSGARG